MKRTVFISHSSVDKAIAEQVCRFLETHGIRCWVAPRDVTPGKNYGAAILDAIDECSVFVLLLTSESNKSGQVVREVERAASSNAVIIPFRVEEVQPSRNLEFYVSSAHWLDAITKPLEKHLRELLQAIKDWQRTGELKEESPPPVTQPVPVPSTSGRPNFIPGGPRLIVALLAALFFCIVLGYVLFRHEKAPRAAAASSSPPAVLSPAPQPMGTAQPTLTPSPAAPVVTPEATAMAKARVPAFTSAPASPTLAPHRRPGELVRSPTPAETPFLPSSAATASPMTKRPGQPIGRGSTPGSALSAPSTKAIESGAPVFRGVVASSQHADHRPKLAFDGDEKTAWMTKDEGVGQTIRVHFKTPAAITSVSIFNGNGEDLIRYYANNRVRSLRMKFSDGTTQVISLEDKMQMQRFELEHRTVTEWVEFEILSVFKGKRNNWTAISEIAFNRNQ
jgi:hypothetical protein